MQKALIWGANGEIGSALTAELADHGWQVIAVSKEDRDIPGADMTFQADVTNDYAVNHAVISAAYEIETVDLWVYAAGDILSRPVEKMTPEEWQRIVGANLYGAYLTVHHSLPLLAENAHMFFLGAVSERLRLPGLSAYAAAKSGLEAFAESLRKEQRRKRVTVVRPGAVATKFWDKVPLRLPKDAASPEKVAKRIITAFETGTSGLLDLT